LILLIQCTTAWPVLQQARTDKTPQVTSLSGVFYAKNGKPKLPHQPPPQYCIILVQIKITMHQPGESNVQKHFPKREINLSLLLKYYSDESQP